MHYHLWAFFELSIDKKDWIISKWILNDLINSQVFILDYYWFLIEASKRSLNYQKSLIPIEGREITSLVTLGLSICLILIIYLVIASIAWLDCDLIYNFFFLISSKSIFPFFTIHTTWRLLTHNQIVLFNYS